MKGPPGPPTPPRVRSADDSVETTSPDPDPRKTPRAPPPSVHALRLLDDEPTVARDRGQSASGADLFAGLRDAVTADPDATLNPDGPTLDLDVPSDPKTLPIGAAVALRSAPAPRLPPSIIVAAPTVAAVGAPPVVAVPPPPPPVAAPRVMTLAPPTPPPPPPRPVAEVPNVMVASLSGALLSLDEPPSPVAPSPATPAPAPLSPLAFATPEDEAHEPSVFAQITVLPCTVRALLNGLRAQPDPRGVERVSVDLLRCVRELHQRGALLGERLVPENFYCHADYRVEYREGPSQPAQEVLDLYRAPELFKARAPTVQSDIFASAAIVYELLVGRSLKPMFLPQVMQSGRTDTWFADPGRSMHEAYKPSLRVALSDRATQRHADLGLFAEELVRAWRLANNPVARLADVEEKEPPWRRLLLPAVLFGAFLLVLLGILLFPVERIDRPAVPTVRPELSQ